MTSFSYREPKDLHNSEIHIISNGRFFYDKDIYDRNMETIKNQNYDDSLLR